MPAVVSGLIQEIYLAVGDQSLADSVNLTNFVGPWTGAGYIIPLESRQVQANQTMPGGISFAWQTNGTLQIGISLLVSGTSGDSIIANLRALFLKGYEGRRGAGGMGLSTAVCLWARWYGSSHYVYFDVTDYAWLPTLPQWSEQVPATMGVLTLTCLPYARGEQITLSASSTMTEGGAGLALTGATAIPGDMEAISQFLLTDNSSASKVIRQVTLFRRSHPLMGSGDFTPAYAITPVSPGTAHSDSTAIGGSCARITTTGAWQELGTFTPVSGAFENGEFNIYLRVRDASVPAVSSTLTPTLALASGTLVGGTYVGQVYTTDHGVLVPETTAASVVVPPQPLMLFEGWEGESLAAWTFTPYVTGVQYLVYGIDGSNAQSGSYALAISMPTGEIAARQLSVQSPTLSYPGTGQISLKFGVQFGTIAGTTGGQTWYWSICNWGNFQLQLAQNSSTGNTWNIWYLNNASNTFGTVTTGSYHTIELFYDQSAGVGSAVLKVYLDNTLELTLDDVPQYAAEPSAWGTYGWTNAVYKATTTPQMPSMVDFEVSDQTPNNGIIGNSTAGLKLYLDNITVANEHIGSTAAGSLGAAITWAWSLNTTGGAQALYYTQPGLAPGPWAVPIGASTFSYALSAPSSGADVGAYPAALPPTQFAEFQIQVAVAVASGTPQWQTLPQGTVSCQVGNGEWEHVMVAAVPLPPVVTPEEQEAPNWIARILGRAGSTTTGTLDVDCAWKAPVDEDQITVQMRTTTPPQCVMQIDTRRDGRVSVLLLDKSSGATIGQADATGSGFRLGPGTNIIGAIVSIADANGNFIGDAVNSAFTLTPIYSPRFLFGRGAI